MKDFRKTNNGLFICEECNLLCQTKKGACCHIYKKHNYKNYYDKWLKEENEGICKICHEKTTFKNFYVGYRNCCSIKCTNKYNYLRTKEEVFKRYGVENNFQRKDCKEKIKQTCLKIFNVEYAIQSIKIKEKGKHTCKEKYGVKYPMQSKEIQEKVKQTCIKKYNVENVFQSEEKKQKIKQTNLKNLGVEYPSQNREIFNKGLKTRFKLHYYKNTTLYYQGSYELDFLENFQNKIDIENGPSIKYIMNNKNKVYHSDFYIPSKNLIIEIKSSWTQILDIELNEKKTAVINSGYNYLLILDKNYENFFLFFS